MCFLHCVSLDKFSAQSIQAFDDVPTEYESDLHDYYNPSTRYPQVK